MVRFSLPYPPSINSYWRTARGRVYVTKRGREYRRLATDIMLKNNVPNTVNPVAVVLLMHPPDRRVRDVDNIQKPVLDALQDYGAVANDSQVVLLTTARMRPTKGGAIHVEIRYRALDCPTASGQFSWEELN